MNTTTATENVAAETTKTVVIPGIGEVDVKVAAEIRRALDASKDVSEASKEITKAKIRQDAKAKYEAKKAEKMKNPEYAEKIAKRLENAGKNKAVVEARKANAEARKAQKAASDARITELLAKAGSKLRADRVVRAEVVPHKAHGLDAIRGYKAILVYTGANVTERNVKQQTFDLDVTGTGVLDDMKSQADACLLAFLKSAK